MARLEAKVISYEEYHPFGTTAYQAKNNDIKSAAKRYRYTGMERDEETGLEYHSARYYLPWLGRWLSADPGGLVDGGNLYRYARNSTVAFTDTRGTDPDDETEPIDIGPLRLRNITGSLNANVNASIGVRDIFSSNRSLSITSLVVGGNLHLTSNLEVPSFGLRGYGGYHLDLASLNVQHDVASVDIEGQANISTGPLTLHLGVSGYGNTILPSNIQFNEASQQLQSSLNEFRGWVGINGRLDIQNLAVGAFSISGDIGPGAQGSLQVHGSFGLPSFDSGPATVLGHITGSGSFEGSRYHFGGGFQADLLPLPVYTSGSWSLDSNRGFQIHGHYFGPQIGPLGLKADINPTGNVEDDSLTLRIRDAIGAGNSNSGTVNMFEPGPSVGYSYFEHSQTGNTFFNVGVSATSSDVPYYRGGVSQPFNGASLGPYVGFLYRKTFQ